MAAQTGYPEDMLDLELDLEADLGIDTVKQAETFAAVRESYDIERDENLELRDFPTLAHVVGWVKSKRPDLAASAAEPTPSAGEGASDASDPVIARVLEVVAEVTGYPEDMLDLELDLEADLGIDTVKQAETFAAVRESYGIERDENLELRDFPTLNHVVAWVRAHLPEDTTASPAPTSGAEASSTPAAQVKVEAPEGWRRVPCPVLRPPLGLCKRTGVELTDGARVVVMADRGGVAASLVSRLRTAGAEPLILEGGTSAEDLSAQLERWADEGPIHGIYWLAGLDREAPLTELSDADWDRAIQVRAKLLYTATRALYDQIAGASRFVVGGTRLGGQHGLGHEGAFAPLGGAVCGFLKTLKREKPEATVKAVDFEGNSEPDAIAERLLQETLLDPGVCEVGYVGDERWTVTTNFVSRPETPVQSLDDDTVFVVTGAAGSIVSAIVEDLAATSAGTFHLLDLTPKPDADDADLQRYITDRDGLQHELFERLKQGGKKATPVAVQKLLSGFERKHAALRAIEAIEKAGGEAHYHCVDLLDGDAVEGAIEQIYERHGKIDVLVHAAGMEISHFLPDKEPSEFNLVFDVKAKGWYHLLSSIGTKTLGSAVAFSSIAGRFGNAGQTDYSAANELLAKSISNLRASRPETRGVVLDWTAWAEIGMASRGSIPKMMELAGIDMLNPADGIPVVRQELTAGTNGEVVVGGALGVLEQEWDDTGGIDVGELEESCRGVLNRRVVMMGVHRGLVVETELDPREQPFLFDHRIGGTAVLPGVMGIEGFGEVATALLPDWHIAAIEKVDFLAPFKFYRDEPRTLTLTAQFVGEGEEVVARCRLSGTRIIMGNPETTTHFTASVRLSRNEVVGQATAQAPPPAEADGKAVRDEDIYEVYFHGPTYRVLDAAWRSDGMVVGRMNDALPANHRPEEMPLVTEPRLVELCFQTAGVWQIGTTGRMGLPHHIDQVRILRRPTEPAGALYAVVTPQDDGRSFDARVEDEGGNLYVVLEGYHTAELPDDVDPDKRQPLRAAMD